MSNTKVRVVRNPEEFESLREIWNGSLQQCREHSSIYLTHDWLWIWWKHFGERHNLNILVIEKEDATVIGILPLMKVEYRLAFASLQVLETIGATNDNYVGLISPGSEEEVLSTLITYLGQDLTKNKLVLRLKLVPKDCYFLNLLEKHSRKVRNISGIHKRIITFAPYLLLPSTWDEYFSSLSRNRRRELRRFLRLLEKQHTVEFKHVVTDILEEQLEAFFKLHQTQWQSVNVRSEFSNPKMRDFYKEITCQFAKRGWLRLSCLSVDGNIVFSTYNFAYNRKLSFAKSARDVRYSKYGVGHIHHMYAIRDAIKRRLSEVDFLKGDEPYKFHWTKSAREYQQIIIFNKGSFSGLRIHFIHAFIRVCEFIQHRHSLRELYSLLKINRRDKKERRRMGYAG